MRHRAARRPTGRASGGRTARPVSRDGGRSADDDLFAVHEEAGTVETVGVRAGLHTARRAQGVCDTRACSTADGSLDHGPCRRRPRRSRALPWRLRFSPRRMGAPGSRSSCTCPPWSRSPNGAAARTTSGARTDWVRPVQKCCTANPAATTSRTVRASTLRRSSPHLACNHTGMRSRSASPVRSRQAPASTRPIPLSGPAGTATGSMPGSTTASCRSGPSPTRSPTALSPSAQEGRPRRGGPCPDSRRSPTGSAGSTRSARPARSPCSPNSTSARLRSSSAET